jgi:glucosamine 6-phosphate synthetase-like amidotransferase/phosphosugar isomerase protein
VCGIFGFALTKPVRLKSVFRIVESLEIQQYSRERRPVGGYGAGLAILQEDNTLLLKKVGKSDKASPAKRLSSLVKSEEARILIGHVRMPSLQFMKTARYPETAQPYVANCSKSTTVVSAHNGFIKNYKAIRRQLGQMHSFESESIELVDSEVIPHYLEEILKEKGVDEALHVLRSTLQGSMALTLLQMSAEGKSLHLVHKGKTRGLVIWENARNEVVFCSRKEPVMAEFADVLAGGKFREKVSIGWNEEKSLSVSYPLKGEA